MFVTLYNNFKDDISKSIENLSDFTLLLENTIGVNGKDYKRK